MTRICIDKICIFKFDLLLWQPLQQLKTDSVYIIKMSSAAENRLWRYFLKPYPEGNFFFYSAAAIFRGWAKPTPPPRNREKEGKEVV